MIQPVIIPTNNVGCMVESAVGITAAAHLAPQVDYADLDGNFLLIMTLIRCESKEWPTDSSRRKWVRCVLDSTMKRTGQN
ncbi:MAG: hypothetical protein CM1200mP10_23480 [Candidatus Neomarinimicrobiota bacterium]|nr:MAG: hypothetical protein CM1200mP10_23480 [Candidatus Neomarinimicrobiota bacterium]